MHSHWFLILSMSLCGIALGVTCDALAQRRAVMYPRLTEYLANRISEFPSISDARRQPLQTLANHITEQRAAGNSVLLTFICTHNSRRSHLSQVWAAAAAAHYQVGGIETFSGHR